MMEGTNYSLSDIRAAVDGGDGFCTGMGGWFWILILFLFRGWGYGCGQENSLISEEFIKRDIFNTNQNISTTACQTQRDVLENRYTNQIGLQQLGAQMQNCCCGIENSILESRYTTQLGFQGLQAQMAECCCNILQAVREDGAETRALIQANTIQDLRDRLNNSQRETDLANSVIQNNAQTQTLLAQINKVPQPAYVVGSPYVSYGYNTCGCGCNYGCN